MAATCQPQRRKKCVSLTYVDRDNEPVPLSCSKQYMYLAELTHFHALGLCRTTSPRLSPCWSKRTCLPLSWSNWRDQSSRSTLA